MRGQITIIGGGLAGLSAGLGLVKKGINVLIIEKHAYPRHKVCGEYVSNEVLAYLKTLGIDPHAEGAVRISTLQCSSLYGQALELKLPLGGFGISRYTLDHLLYKIFLESGGTLVHDEVVDVIQEDDIFKVQTASGNCYEGTLVLGTFGKRSRIDIKSSRQFINEKTPWLGIKMHYKAPWNPDRVSLHNFKGGYCGISQVEDKRINMCYLVHIDVFRKYKNIDLLQQEILRKNRYIDQFLNEATPLFDAPLSISQISFHKKERLHQGMLLCGDSASLIHPLCGNGMAMAIMGSKILVEAISFHLDQNTSLTELEQHYVQEWERHFNKRLRWGSRLQDVFTSSAAANYGIAFMRHSPWILKQFIKNTHGK